MPVAQTFITRLAYAVDESGIRRYERLAIRAHEHIQRGIHDQTVAQEYFNEELDDTVATYGVLNAEASKFKKTTATTEQSWGKTGKHVRNVSHRFNYIEHTARSFVIAAGAIAAAGAGLAAAAGAFQIDRVIRARARMRLALDQGNVASEFARVEDIARNTGNRIIPTVNLFRSLRRSTGSETAQITELIAKAITAGGGRLSQKQSGLQRVAQAMSKGFFDSGDVENLFEDLPALAAILARAFNIEGDTLQDTKNGLVQLADKWEDLNDTGLSTSKFINELIASTDILNEKLDDMPKQFRQGLNVMVVAFTKYVDELNQAFRISDKFFALSEALANNIGTIFRAIMLIGVSGAVSALGHFFAKYGKALMPFLMRWLQIMAVVYGIWLIGQDILIWLEGGNSVTGLLLSKFETLNWIAHQIGDAIQSFAHYLGIGADKWGEWVRFGFTMLILLYTMNKLTGGLLGKLGKLALTLTGIRGASRMIGRAGKGAAAGAAAKGGGMLSKLGGWALGIGGFLGRKVLGPLALMMKPSPLGNSTLEAYKSSHPGFSLPDQTMSNAAQTQLQAGKMQLDAAKNLQRLVEQSVQQRTPDDGVLNINITEANGGMPQSEATP